MAKITFKGNPINSIGTLPAVGSKAPDFKLTADDGSEVSLHSLRGKRVVLYFFPKALTPG